MRQALFLVPCLVLAVPASLAAPADQVSVSYSFDVTSITMMTVKFDLDLSSEAVRARARVKTKGLSELFSEYSAKVVTQSRWRGDEIVPAEFRLTREKRDRTKVTVISWSEAGKVSMDPPAHKKPEIQARVERALTGEVADPVTAILKVGSTGANPCPSRQRAFDGQNVFELSFTDLGMGQAKAGSYEGPVQNCIVRWSPIAGRAAEKGEPGEDYKVSFAEAGTLPTGQSLWLPVSLSGTIKGLPFEAYVTRLEAGAVRSGDSGDQD